LDEEGKTGDDYLKKICDFALAKPGLRVCSIIDIRRNKEGFYV
jgi:hypothetical protein